MGSCLRWCHWYQSSSSSCGIRNHVKRWMSKEIRIQSWQKHHLSWRIQKERLMQRMYFDKVLDRIIRKRALIEFSFSIGWQWWPPCCHVWKWRSSSWCRLFRKLCRLRKRFSIWFHPYYFLHQLDQGAQWLRIINSWIFSVKKKKNSKAQRTSVHFFRSHFSKVFVTFPL